MQILGMFYSNFSVNKYYKRVGGFFETPNILRLQTKAVDVI